MLQNINRNTRKLIGLFYQASFCSNLSNSQTSFYVAPQKSIGQPTHGSHPHLVKAGEVTPNITKEEYKQRRKNLIEVIDKYNYELSSSFKSFMIVLPSSTKKYMSDKIPYVFRQNTDFLYFTGCLEPESCLVILRKSPDEYTSVLFSQGRDTNSELWDGPRICPSTVNEFFGIDRGLPIRELGNYLYLHLKSNSGMQIWYDVVNPEQKQVHNTMNTIIKTKNNLIENPKFLFDQIRILKSPAEIELMRKSCQIASKAIIKTIEHSHPGINEHEIFARVDYESRIQGAEYLAYPPVVAGGKRANIIHYINNNQIVEDGEIVLMDAGCEYHGYSSDITRTWPIGGKFTSEQKELYEAVLETQMEIIELCKHFPSLDSLFDSMCKILGKKLQNIGLINKSISTEGLVKATYEFCPHHVSHYLGMDVHDTPSISRNIPIKPGMIITVEPGVYVNQNNEAVPKKYRGIGIRIEDDILISENGPEVLTRDCPKDVTAIEKIALENT